MSNKLTTFRGCRHYLHFTQTLSELELPLPGDITPRSVQYILQSHPFTTQDVTLWNLLLLMFELWS